MTDARNFKEAYARFDPAVVLLDMIMPEVDGIEVIDWLASVKSLAQIIIISGLSPIYAKAAVALGVEGPAVDFPAGQTGLPGDFDGDANAGAGARRMLNEP